MSERFSTEELVEYLWQLVTYSTSANPEGRDVDIGKMIIAIAKLRAADKLYEAIKKVRGGKLPLCECEDCETLRKAIAEYGGEGGNHEL